MTVFRSRHKKAVKRVLGEERHCPVGLVLSNFYLSHLLPCHGSTPAACTWRIPAQGVTSPTSSTNLSSHARQHYKDVRSRFCQVHGYVNAAAMVAPFQRATTISSTRYLMGSAPRQVSKEPQTSSIATLHLYPFLINTFLAGVASIYPCLDYWSDNGIVPRLPMVFLSEYSWKEILWNE